MQKHDTVVSIVHSIEGPVVVDALEIVRSAADVVCCHRGRELAL